MKQEKTIDEEIRENLEAFFKKTDKMIEADIGKMCHPFDPECAQCKLHLIYNKFKLDYYEEMLRRMP